MENKMVKTILNFAASQNDNVVFENEALEDLSSEQARIIEYFHMEEIYLVKEDDDYFCGMRADHFCVEYGWSEGFCSDGKPTHSLILITANHKGHRRMTLLRLEGYVG